MVRLNCTQVPFHGLGIETARPILPHSFGCKQTYGGADFRLRPHRWLHLRAGALFEDFSIKPPTGSLSFVEESTRRPRPQASASIPRTCTPPRPQDSTRGPPPTMRRRGGLYEVTHHRYSDRDSTYSFSRVDAEAVQHIPILRENWVISLRGSLQTHTGDDDQVPYFCCHRSGAAALCAATAVGAFAIGMPS